MFTTLQYTLVFPCIRDPLFKQEFNAKRVSYTWKNTVDLNDFCSYQKIRSSDRWVAVTGPFVIC